MYDPELYRSKDEVERWRQRCPIQQFSERLRGWDWLRDADDRALEAEIAGIVEAAVAEAEAGPREPVADLLKDVCTPRSASPSRCEANSP